MAGIGRQRTTARAAVRASPSTVASAANRVPVRAPTVEDKLRAIVFSAPQEPVRPGQPAPVTPSIVEAAPLTDEQIQQLTQLTLFDGRPMFELRKADLTYQVSACIFARGFDETFRFLAGRSWPNRRTIVLDLPTVVGGKPLTDIPDQVLKIAEIFRKKLKAARGPPCKSCASTNTSMTYKQMRSADEPATQVIICGDCRFRWTAG